MARHRGLSGYVRNLGDAGVDILIQGATDALEAFLTDLKQRSPALARLDHVDVQRTDHEIMSEFVIEASGDEGGAGGQLPPDVATCEACVGEILGDSRFHGYWATSCTDCGPRFTVVEGLPYDRPRTSMAAFPMCADCAAEYGNPLDRRYHAQTTACAVCGPTLQFDGEMHDALPRAVRALADGRIVAVKGIGGTHIACDATQPAVIQTLRDRLGRPSQPFAIMGPEELLREYVQLTAEAAAELARSHRPIVVVPKRDQTTLPNVSPGLHTVGAMRPYTGLHHLLFSSIERPLVMTSANRPGEPMLVENERIRKELRGIADHLLLHDRRIVSRCDDSVRRQVAGRWVFLRRSRGLVPQGLRWKLGSESILALGAESDLTFALYDRSLLTVSQHIGTVDDPDTLQFLREAITHLSELTRARPPSVVACDAHPAFLTSQLAEEIASSGAARLVRVQHHASHLAAVLMDNDVREDAVGIALDGYGYGPDGSAWGGELLIVRGRSVERVGSLAPVRLPGGDLAAREPLRIVAAYWKAAGWSDERVASELEKRGMTATAIGVLLRQIDAGVNAPWTTSAGRFLDAVSALLGVCARRTYEGEPAMRLEAAAVGGHPLPLHPQLTRQGAGWRLDLPGWFEELTDLAGEVSVQDMAATAQQALAEGFARMALAVAEEYRLRCIALSGGVAYNDHVVSTILRLCAAHGFDLLTHQHVPSGDGGVSAGQAAYAGLGWTLHDLMGTMPSDQTA